MKINWFSPLPPARTGIADFTMHAADELLRVAETVFWDAQQHKVSPALSALPIVQYQPGNVDWRRLNRADGNIYHIANHSEFHHTILIMARLHPGVVVLHDLVLWHLFQGTHLHFEDESHQLDFNEAMGSDTAPTPPGVRAVLEYTLEAAKAAVVHSQAAYQHLERLSRCPVYQLNLPHKVSDEAASAELREKRWRNLDPIRLVMFGHIGVNRRLLEILDALALFRGACRFHLDIYGMLSQKAEARKLIRNSGLKARVTLHEYSSEAVVRAGLDAAHLAFNLRYPTVGEASASQLKLWEHAVPTLVTPLGWYKSLPSDAVLPVPVGRERETIHEHLERIAADALAYRRIGERGREVVTTDHTPRGYAEGMVEIVRRHSNESVSQRQGRYARCAAERIVQLSPRLEADDRFCARLAHSIASLSG